MTKTTQTGTWKSVFELAKKAGAKYPDLVAAQWALESDWGKSAPGNNFFGLKGKGQSLGTTEVINGVVTAIRDSFLTFPSIEASVQYLVDKWYKDYKSYKGMNNAPTIWEAAKQLQAQGYATDPKYATKLTNLLKQHGLELPGPAPTPPAAPAPTKPVIVTPAAPVLFRIRALRDTVLKKEPKQASELEERMLHRVKAGQIYEVVGFKEQAADAHEWVKLGHGAGVWYIWGPHWQRVLPPGPPVLQAGQVDWNDFNARVTPNVTVGEVVQWDKRRIPQPGSPNLIRIWRMAQEFEAIRAAWGSPIAITSWYRPEPINRMVGGVPGSKHVTGEAIDFYPRSGGLDRFYQWLRVRWTGGFGDGRDRGFIHIDNHTGAGRFVPGAGVLPAREWNY